MTVLAQLLAGAQSDEQLAEPTARALALWIAEVETVLRRLLAQTPLADLADPAGLARAVSAAFIGLELFEGVDPAGASAAARHARTARRPGRGGGRAGAGRPPGPAGQSFGVRPAAPVAESSLSRC